LSGLFVIFNFSPKLIITFGFGLKKAPKISVFTAMSEEIYLHGFTEKEQQRLIDQALFLKNWVNKDLDLSKVSNLLEIGSGVGAQTMILLNDFPHLKITGIDQSRLQLKKAEKNLEQFPKFKGHYEFHQMNAHSLEFANETFDGVYLCWVLEHVSNPQQVLKEAFRVLKPGGTLIASEVFNHTFFTYPEMPAIMDYWKKYCQFQLKASGDPNIGSKLGNFLANAGFKDFKTNIKPFFADQRDPEAKRKILEYWTELLLSGAPNLIDAGIITDQEAEALKREFEMLNNDKNGVFFYAFVQAIATK
jgi:ubiquinone/menaquinone biosynthesis C-methylase UbiE